jgi:glycosyltransferase involved in cell wall biosynthesis
MADPLISIVLPVYNQADHIGSIVENFQQALSRISNPVEYVLVVNGSSDHSLEVSSALAARTPTVHVINSAKGGWGLAVRLGLQAAQGDLLCYTNSARTTAQDLVLLLLYAIANPGNVIKANRKVRENWQRRMGSLLYNLECRALFDFPYWDVNGTPKVFPRAFDKLLLLTRTDDLIDAEFNMICRRENYPMLEVPIFSVRRHSGRSTTNYRSALRMYLGAYQLWRSTQNQSR